MVTTVTRDNEPNATAAAHVAEPVAAAPAAPAIDISAVPETPAELLKQWDTPRRSFLAVMTAALLSVWDSVTGPASTEQERVERKIFEHNREIRAQGPHF